MSFQKGLSVRLEQGFALGSDLPLLMSDSCFAINVNLEPLTGELCCW